MAKIPANLRDISVEYAFVSVDMSGHSLLVQKYLEKFEPVRKQLRTYSEERIKKRGGAPFSWEGDGGMAIFWGDNDFVERAVWAALSILTDMYLFNLEHNPFSEFIDVKVGVHRGNATAKKLRGDWFGTGLNDAGHFFGKELLPGFVKITGPVYQALNIKARERFHKTQKFGKFNVFEFGRHRTDPDPQVFVRYLEANRTIEILNHEGDAKISHIAKFLNTHPTISLNKIDGGAACPEHPMTWSDFKLKVWNLKNSRKLAVVPQDDQKYRKSWEVKFPDLEPDSDPFEMGYSFNWLKMFPNIAEMEQSDYWETYIPYDTESLSLTVVFPKGFKPQDGGVTATRKPYYGGEIIILENGVGINNPSESGSNKWEAYLKLERPDVYSLYQLIWQLEEE